MKQENQDQLLKDFPLLFGHIANDEQKRHSITRFGLECGDGWYELIYKLCEDLEKEIEQLPQESRSQYRVFQIKEKFGTLRFYLVSHRNTKIQRLIYAAEKKSAKICEICGVSDACLRKKSGWYKTLCDEHAEGYEKAE